MKAIHRSKIKTKQNFDQKSKQTYMREKNQLADMFLKYALVSSETLKNLKKTIECNCCRWQ